MIDSDYTAFTNEPYGTTQLYERICEDNRFPLLAFVRSELGIEVESYGCPNINNESLQ